MKYKVNESVGFKSKSVGNGKIVSFEKETSMYSVRVSNGSIIKCTEHYITEPMTSNDD